VSEPLIRRDTTGPTGQEQLNMVLDCEGLNSIEARSDPNKGEAIRGAHECVL
jgi:hypothetical protein